MTIKLFHHPFSRASGTVWALEEVGQPYELVWTDIMKGEQKKGELPTLNPMGKLPTLVDGDAVVSEAAAIALYLADRYASGTLAPALDDPRRGAYLRWAMIPSAVIEPGMFAHASKWEYRPGAAGWGTYEEMLATIEQGVSTGAWVLGDMFSMADVVFGGTLRYMTMVKMLQPSDAVKAYLGRIAERPALQRADEKNASVVKERGIKVPGQG